MLLDKTIVVYKGEKECPVSIHYRICGPGETQAGPEQVMEMQHMYAGIYAARFVCSRRAAAYFITETFAGRPQEKLDEGELRAADSLFSKGTRYGFLNEVLSDSLTRTRARHRRSWSSIC